MTVSALAPHVFICYWYGRTLAELAAAQRTQSSPADQRQLGTLRERARLYEALLVTPTAATVLNETELVQALRRAANGSLPTLRARIAGVIAQEARDLLRKWHDPQRDALYTSR